MAPDGDDPIVPIKMDVFIMVLLRARCVGSGQLIPDPDESGVEIEGPIKGRV